MTCMKTLGYVLEYLVSPDVGGVGFAYKLFPGLFVLHLRVQPPESDPFNSSRE